MRWHPLGIGLISFLAMLSVVAVCSAISSSSQRRPRAIDATKVARFSERIGRACSVRQHLKPSQEIDDRGLVHTHVARVEVQPEQLIIQLAEAQGSDRQKVGSNAALQVAWQKTISRRRRAILVPDGMLPQHARPLRSENRATLVASIARGRRWLDELITAETATTDSIAKRERCSVRKVNMTISLAFLAPDLVKAAIDGRLPHGMGVARLADLPAEWSRQHQMLGLAAQ
jgi:hypothetical protein